MYNRDLNLNDLLCEQSPNSLRKVLLRDIWNIREEQTKLKFKEKCLKDKEFMLSDLLDELRKKHPEVFDGN